MSSHFQTSPSSSSSTTQHTKIFFFQKNPLNRSEKHHEIRQERATTHHQDPAIISESSELRNGKTTKMIISSLPIGGQVRKNKSDKYLSTQYMKKKINQIIFSFVCVECCEHSIFRNNNFYNLIFLLFFYRSRFDQLWVKLNGGSASVRLELLCSPF